LRLPWIDCCRAFGKAEAVEGRAEPDSEGVKMDREQQTMRIRKIVNTIAERCLGVPPKIRAAFIQEEVAKAPPSQQMVR
jgi:hypothetical protein